MPFGWVRVIWILSLDGFAKKLILFSGPGPAFSGENLRHRRVQCREE